MIGLSIDVWGVIYVQEKTSHDEKHPLGLLVLHKVGKFDSVPVLFAVELTVDRFSCLLLLFLFVQKIPQPHGVGGVF